MVTGWQQRGGTVDLPDVQVFLGGGQVEVSSCCLQAQFQSFDKVNVGLELSS